ncbi:TlpA family protein disulfide reductase [Maribacter sp. 2304DJ31-5]|uniref:TlpA family protein disulfide reductase n=1 Tax=Maribacter sp. 2304DJ31-5 TaxID=3386273 RepID=UPI0039BC47EF
MKKFLIFTLLGALLMSFNNKKEEIKHVANISAEITQSNIATLKGKFFNYKKDSTYFQIKFNGKGREALDVTVNDDFTFELNYEMERPGFFTMTTAKGSYDIYLEPGKTVEFSMDPNVTDPPQYAKSPFNNYYLPNNSTLKFTGDLVKENTFINKHKSVEIIGLVGFHKVMKEDKLNDGVLYKEKITKLYNEQLEIVNKFIKKNPDLHDDFVYLKRKQLELQKVSLLSWFEMRTVYYYKEDAKNMPADYYDFEKTFNYNDDFLYKSESKFPEFLSIQCGGNDWKKSVTKIESLFTRQDFKDKFLANLKYHFTNLDKEKEAPELLAVLKGKITDKELLAKVEEAYGNSLLVAKGTPVENFTYKDVNDKDVSLSDFKGKFVYIDFWATWCGPCKVEIPHLEKLEKKYHDKDIVFLSISSDKSISAWKKMVADKNLSGVQVNIGEDNSLMDFLGIRGIPRFTLLDKEGKIVAANAPRPSQEKEIATLFAISGVNK